MSDLVFPTLPGLSITVNREPRYATQIHEAVSGKEVRVGWRTVPKIRYQIKVTARNASNAPSPYSAITETQIILDFLDDHLGSLDSFLLPDPYTTSNVRVRFVEDSLRMTQIVSGWWAFESVEFESVL